MPQDKIPIIIDRKTFDELITINITSNERHQEFEEKIQELIADSVEQHRKFKGKARELTTGASIDLSNVRQFGAAFPTKNNGAIRNTIECLNQLAKYNKVEFDVLIDEKIIQEHKLALEDNTIMKAIDYKYLKQKPSAELENLDKIPIIIDKKTFNELITINTTSVEQHREFKVKIRELTAGSSIDLSNIRQFGAIFPTKNNGAVRNTIECLNQLAEHNKVKFDVLIDEKIIQEHKLALTGGIMTKEIDYKHLKQKPSAELENLDNLRQARYKLAHRKKFNDKPLLEKDLKPPRKSITLQIIKERDKNYASKSSTVKR